MKWEQFTLKMEVDTGETDELGNPIMDYPDGPTITGRATSWTAEEIQVEDREITTGTRKIVTTALLSTIKNAAKVSRNGEDYDVIQVRTNGRFRQLIVKGYRV